MIRQNPKNRGLRAIIVLLLPTVFAVGCQSRPGPERFVDHARFEFDDHKKDLQRTRVPLEHVPLKIDRKEKITFEMTRIPGDPEQGIKPFYLSTTEVPANMFFPWATGEGLGRKELETWGSYDLHPSRISEEARLYGPMNRPAMGMSRRAAELYCQWLSQHTGRTYRLPTEAEWEHAFKLAGGVPADKAALLTRATLANNAKQQAGPPWYPLPTAVGEREPDTLGLHDLLGNAAEWVTDTGKDRAVRGGHFMVEADELSADWRWVEDLEVWIGSSPFPIDPDDQAYWYRDFYFTGIRLSCDEDQAPAKKNHE